MPRLVVITGATGGFGRAVVRERARHGDRLALLATSVSVAIEAAAVWGTARRR